MIDRSRKRWGWTLGIVPLLAFVVIFFLIPQIDFLRSAFFKTNSVGQVYGGVTSQTFREATSSYYLGALVQTVELCAIIAVLAAGVAYALAYTIVRSHRWGRLILLLVVATMFSNAVALVLGWQAFLSTVGPVDRLLVNSGLVSHPLQLTNNSIGVVIGTVQAIVPLGVLSLMPICEMVDTSELEAASSLGASPERVLFKVFFPQTRAAVVSVGLLLFAVTAGSFTTPALLGGGRVPMLSVLIYSIASQNLNYSLAAALGLILLIVVGMTVLIALVVGRRGHRVPLTSF